MPDDATTLAVRCADAMYAKDIASQALGITIDEVGSGSARARMTVQDTMLNGHGICHGGYVFTLADTAFAFACNTYDEVTVAAGADVTFLAPVHAGTTLLATATERNRRGRSGLYDVTVATDAGDIVAEFRGRSRSLGRPLLSPT
jgi:phenylacetic acid degradation protein PaaD